MINRTKQIHTLVLRPLMAALLAGTTMSVNALDLLHRYQTKLTTGILQPEQARPWQFTQNDVYRLSRFQLEIPNQLTVETGPADLGIGHCIDGAIWAVVIPTDSGSMKRGAEGSGEPLSHIFLRFHPAQINQIFPPDTVSAAASTSVASQMQPIAGVKFRASYYARGNATIPEPKDMTLDVDTKAGVRRFFIIDTQAGKTEYVSAFESQGVPLAAKRSSGDVPKVLMSKPANGATEVDPGLTEIAVTFDQEMGDGMSWTGGGPEYPPSPEGENAEWRGKRTWVLPVKLEPGHHYRVGINSRDYRGFCSAWGDPVAPRSISFTTK